MLKIDAIFQRSASDCTTVTLGTPKSLGFDFPKCDNVKQKTGAQKRKFTRPKKENKMKNKKVLVSTMIPLLLLSVLASTALAAPPVLCQKGLPN
jgi:hypothetical protein